MFWARNCDAVPFVKRYDRVHPVFPIDCRKMASPHNLSLVLLRLCPTAAPTVSPSVEVVRSVYRNPIVESIETNSEETLTGTSEPAPADSEHSAAPMAGLFEDSGASFQETSSVEPVDESPGGISRTDGNVDSGFRPIVFFAIAAAVTAFIVGCFVQLEPIPVREELPSQPAQGSHSDRNQAQSVELKNPTGLAGEAA